MREKCILDTLNPKFIFSSVGVPDNAPMLKYPLASGYYRVYFDFIKLNHIILKLVYFIILMNKLLDYDLW